MDYQEGTVKMMNEERKEIKERLDHRDHLDLTLLGQPMWGGGGQHVQLEMELNYSMLEEQLCLPDSPEYLPMSNTVAQNSNIYGAEYHLRNIKPEAQNQNAPCAVCYTPILILPCWWSQPGPTALPHRPRSMWDTLSLLGMRVTRLNLNVSTKILNTCLEREGILMVCCCTLLKLCATLE